MTQRLPAAEEVAKACHILIYECTIVCIRAIVKRSEVDRRMRRAVLSEGNCPSGSGQRRRLGTRSPAPASRTCFGRRQNTVMGRRFHHRVLNRYLDDVDIRNASDRIYSFCSQEGPIGMEPAECCNGRRPNKRVDRVEQNAAGHV